MTKIFTLKKAKKLAKSITELNESKTLKFSDGEIKVELLESVRNNRVYVIGSPRSSNDIMELMMFGDAIKRGAAKEIIAIIPYMPYMRQDRKDVPRTAIGAKVFANMMEIYYDHVITFDLHANQIEGFFNIPVTHINSINIFATHIINNFDLKETMIVSPDIGGAKRAKKLSNILDVPLAIINKERKMANQVSSMELMGDVSGKNVIIYDDMVDTAGSLCKAADTLKQNGAKKVWACATHGVLSGGAYAKLLKSSIEKLYITDTIKTEKHEKIKILSCSDTIKRTIDVIEKDDSINFAINNEKILLGN